MSLNLKLTFYLLSTDLHCTVFLMGISSKVIKEMELSPLNQTSLLMQEIRLLLFNQ